MSEVSAAVVASPTPDQVESPPGGDRTLWGDVRYELVRSPIFWLSSAVVLLALLMSFAPFLFAPTSPTEGGACDLVNARVKPTWGHPFGYTASGCDMWSSLVWGTGKSVNVAILTTMGTVILGVTSGTAAGWYGGFTDTLISRVTDVFFGLPFLLGAIVFLAIFPTRNVATISLVLTLLGWTSITRVMRGSVLATKQRDYVDAARALGASDFYIIRRHIVANSIAPVIVLATIGLGAIIGVEATLTFLGVGYQRPSVSWGLLVNEGQTLVFAGFSHLLLYPCAFIVATVLAFILLGDVLRDALDPRSR